MIRTSYFFFFIITFLTAFSLFVFRTSFASPPTPYPVSEAFDEGYLHVSPIHQLWYAQYGNPKGVPVVVLHGGPGAGCANDDMRYFDPSFWRIVLFDQRGAKRSKPFGEVRDNTTQDLVNDIEVLRTKLNIDQWLVFGGSWGSALALAYGETHPQRALGFVLRGIFLGTEGENNNLWYGMRDTFPEVWQEFNDFIPEDEQADLISAYHKRVINSDPNSVLAAADAFMKYDTICSYLKISPEQLQQAMSDKTVIVGIARMFIHYSINHFFMPEGQLLDKVQQINHLPLIIVQGRYDTIARSKNAYKLHQLWPNSELIFAEASGHSAREPQITLELVNATEKMKHLVLH